MNIKPRYIEIGGIQIEIVRKPIRHLRLGVFPPTGRVRVSAPLHVNDAAVRSMVVSRLNWIRRHQARFVGQPQPLACEMVTGEAHYYQGQRYPLQVIETQAPPKVVLNGNATLELYARPGADAARRAVILDGWYRQQLKTLLPDLIARWQPVIGVDVAAWGVRKMKTRWGSCNTRTRRIWLNLALARKPLQCLEYVVVHEMVHLLEPNHNARFKQLMDSFLPRWRLLRAELNRAPQRE
ncbi:MAG: protein of unknown function DUF45 [Gammaproteobacteria bacterium]|nr:protein of unknown function DUF45 [Gammaproteobacteria bacterium]